MNYIGTIKKVYKIDLNQEKIIIELFDMLGSPITIRETTVSNWFKGRKKRGYDKYFPNRNYNETRFINYFKRRKTVIWEESREAFRLINSGGIVKCDTNEPEVFYHSLFIQFLMLLQLPLPEEEEPSDNIKVEIKSQGKISSEEIAELSYNDYLDTEPVHIGENLIEKSIRVQQYFAKKFDDREKKKDQQ